ncbi:MAG: hypothetical protein U0835_16645 [Isosphaeraceae bacterium]
MPLGLLGALLLVAAVESGLPTTAARLPTRWRSRGGSAAEAAERLAPGCQVLCLGDSLAKHGLVPQVLTETSGRSSCNLAAAAAPTPLTFFLLKRALDAGARPEAVVLDLKPSVLAGGPRFRLRDWPEALRAGELVDLAWTSGGGGLFAELALNSLLPSYRARHDVRDATRAALRGEVPRLRELNAICWRNWTLNRGANLAHPRPSYTGAVSEAEHRDLLSHRFGLHRVNVRYLHRAIDLAVKRGVAVYLVLPPFAPELMKRRRETGAEAAYTEFVRSLQRAHPGVNVLDARPSGYAAGVFVDAIHLDRRGAVRLSLDVGEALARGPDRPGRWVELPPFRLPADRPELEDAEQSRERLGIAWRPGPAASR